MSMFWNYQLTVLSGQHYKIENNILRTFYFIGLVVQNLFQYDCFMWLAVTAKPTLKHTDEMSMVELNRTTLTLIKNLIQMKIIYRKFLTLHNVHPVNERHAHKNCSHNRQFRARVHTSALRNQMQLIIKLPFYISQLLLFLLL